MLKTLGISCLFLVACSTKQGTTYNDCLTVSYVDSSDHFRIIQKIVLDTTACLIHATIIDFESKKLVSGGQMQINRGGDKVNVLISKDGTAQIFRNGIQGSADLTFRAKGYSCLTIKEFMISGGQLLSVRLRKR